jgi:hypothetical protein
MAPDTCTARTQLPEQSRLRIPAQPEHNYQNNRDSGYLYSQNTTIRTVVTPDTCTARTQLSEQSSSSLPCSTLTHITLSQIILTVGHIKSTDKEDSIARHTI